MSSAVNKYVSSEKETIVVCMSLKTEEKLKLHVFAFEFYVLSVRQLIDQAVDSFRAVHSNN
jgi:hypothetical protein